MLVDWWFIYILGVHVTCNMFLRNQCPPHPFSPSLPPFLPPFLRHSEYYQALH